MGKAEKTVTRGSKRTAERSRRNRTRAQSGRKASRGSCKILRLDSLRAILKELPATGCNINVGRKGQPGLIAGCQRVSRRVPAMI